MLDRTRNLIVFVTWSVEKRGRYWYISRPAFFTDPAVEKGPFSTITSACLMIARELVNEAKKRHGKN